MNAKWINAKYLTPEVHEVSNSEFEWKESEWVLGYVEKTDEMCVVHFCIDFLCGESRPAWEDQGGRILEVSHWMPLPVKP